MLLQKLFLLPDSSKKTSAVLLLHPHPFLLHFSCSLTYLQSLRPSLLIILLSSPSLYLFHSLPRKTLIGSLIIPEIPLSGKSIEAFAFKLETAAERKSGADKKLLKGLEYYPSGSFVDGLSAALLGRCQILKIRGVLCVCWPEFDASVVSLVKVLVQRDVLPGLDLSLSHEKGDELPVKFGRSKDHPPQFDLYA